MSTVDHPDHYGGESNPYEAIKIIEAHDLGFCLGNAVKYLLRAGKKASSSRTEDLEKAIWYITREVQHGEDRSGHHRGTPARLDGDEHPPSRTMSGPRKGIDPPWTYPVSDREEKTSLLSGEIIYPQARRIYIPERGTGTNLDPAGETHPTPQAAGRDEAKSGAVHQRIHKLTAELIRLTMRRDQIKEELLRLEHTSAGQ